MQKPTKYKELTTLLRKKITSGQLTKGDLLPSENELCTKYSITRTTVRMALEQLVKDGLIEKQKGRGSVVRENRKSLGLLNVKGFSEVVGNQKLEVQNEFLENPCIRKWPETFFYSITKEEHQSDCIFIKRLRKVQDKPIVVEETYISGANQLKSLHDLPFVNGSLFETLQQKYDIEILDVEEDLRAIQATLILSELLKIDESLPVLQIFLKFTTSNKIVNIYSVLFCNTEQYSVSNKLS